MRKKILGLLLASFLFVGCGVKEPKTKLPDGLNRLIAPDYSLKHTGLKLDSLGPRGLGLSGALTFWKKQEDGDIEPFKKVVKYSNTMKESMGGIARVNLEKETLGKELAKLEEKVSKAFGTHVKFFFDRILKDHLARDHIERLEQSSIPEADFKLFCDSQYVDFCRSKLLLEEDYTRRPTPNSLCEPYYERQGYFASDRCSSQETGKNYFSCFWSTDFLEKSNFNLMRKGLSGFENLSSAEINSDEFQEAWASEDWVSYFAKKERYLKLSILKRSEGEKLYFYYDNPKKKMGDHLSLPIPSELNELYTRNKGLDGGIKYSFADLIFNSDRLANKETELHTYSIREDDEKDLADLNRKHPALFGASYEVFDAENLEEAKELIELKKESQKKNEDFDTKLRKLNEDLSETKKDFDNLFVGTNKKGKEKDLAYSMWSKMKLSLSNNDDGTVELSWTLHDDILMGEGDDDAIIPPTFSCTLKKEGAKKKGKEDPTKLNNCTFNRDTGKLKFTLGKDLYSQMGWMLLPKKGNGASFNFIDKRELQGATLSFNLDYILYENVMPMFSGEATLSTRNKDYWGTVLVKLF